ncbi:hypothetical protein ACLOJK_028780 [Asimina triloba]
MQLIITIILSYSCHCTVKFRFLSSASAVAGMGKKELEAEEKIDAVLQILQKQAPLTVKQVVKTDLEKFCNDVCVGRFLRAKGDSVKKAAKHLRSCLSWRDSIGTGTEHLIADEFSAELVDGVAYVAGNDQEARPVVVFRIKQDYQKFHSRKFYIRLLVFTLEVAVATMSRSVEQFVLLFDARPGAGLAGCTPIRGMCISRPRQSMPVSLLTFGPTPPRFESCTMRKKEACVGSGMIGPDSFFLFIFRFFRSGSAFMNLLLPTLKILSEYYPGRLHKAFVIDPPSLFSCLWKGVRPFVELSPMTTLVSSLDFEDPLDDSFTSYPRTSSLRFEPSSVPTKIGSCSSSRFAFTVSHFDSLKPWYLSRTDTSSTSNASTGSGPSIMGPALVSPLNARSYSFASPAARATPRGLKNFPSTPQPARASSRPSFLQSPAAFFRKDAQLNSSSKCRESFYPYLRFYRKPYDEMIYRSKMRPPLGGLISIVSPHLKRRHITSKRF